MRTTLRILDGSGDTKLTWNHESPEECAEARKTVADLKAKGYLFFLVDGSQVKDEVDQGGGTLIVRALTGEEVVETATAPEDIPETPEPQAKRRRGRPRKAAEPADADAKNVLAVRPMAGG